MNSNDTPSDLQVVAGLVVTLLGLSVLVGTPVDFNGLLARILGVVVLGIGLVAATQLPIE